MFVKITAVEYKAKIALINACPVSIRIFKLRFDFFRIGRLVCFQKSFLFRHNERIGAAAIPYTGLGIILFQRGYGSKVSPPLIRTKFTLMPVSFSNSLATTFADCSTTPMYTVISFDSFFAAGLPLSFPLRSL